MLFLLSRREPLTGPAVPLGPPDPGSGRQEAQPHHRRKKAAQPFISQMGRPWSRQGKALIKGMEWLRKIPVSRLPFQGSVYHTPVCCIHHRSSPGVEEPKPFCHPWLLEFALKRGKKKPFLILVHERSFLDTASLLGIEIKALEPNGLRLVPAFKPLCFWNLLAFCFVLF